MARTGTATSPFMNLDGPLKSHFSTPPQLPTVCIRAVPEYVYETGTGHPSANKQTSAVPVCAAPVRTLRMSYT